VIFVERKKRWRAFFITLCWALFVCGTDGQTPNPAKIEDASIERAKILKAADQMDLLAHQNELLLKEIEILKLAVARLEEENKKIRKEMAEEASARARERELLIEEVTRLTVGGKASAAKTPPPASIPAEHEKGYEHVVAAGETLWTIALAYRKEGVSVSAEELAASNRLPPNGVIRPGQKIFIPKK
jgi:nucleoid-associated protein YgaU